MATIRIELKPWDPTSHKIFTVSDLVADQIIEMIPDMVEEDEAELERQRKEAESDPRTQPKKLRERIFASKSEERRITTMEQDREARDARIRAQNAEDDRRAREHQAAFASGLLAPWSHQPSDDTPREESAPDHSPHTDQESSGGGGGGAWDSGSSDSGGSGDSGGSSDSGGGTSGE